MSVVRLPAHVMRSVFQELKDLSTHPVEGIKVVPNEKDVTEITAIIDGPEDTPFAGGQFTMKLKLGPDFPASPPKGFFLTNIFHPNIKPGTGEICVNTLKKDWKETLGFKHVLLTIKCLLIEPNPDSSLNAEAGRLFQDSYSEYYKHAAHLTQIHAIKEKKDEKKDAADSSESKENISNNTTSDATNAAKKITTTEVKKKAAAKTKRGAKRL